MRFVWKRLNESRLDIETGAQRNYGLCSSHAVGAYGVRVDVEHRLDVVVVVDR